MSFARLLCVSASFLLITGCGDSIKVVPDASPADASPPLDAPAGPRISIRVRPVVAGAAIPDGRLVVAFYQQNDDLTVDPKFHVGYDVAFSGQSQMIEIPLGGVVLPGAIDDYRFCPRDCEDLSDPACDCRAAEAKVAMAYVFVLPDANGSGKIESAEVSLAGAYGIGQLFLGATDKAYPLPNTLDFMFIEGLVEGLAPYRLIPPAPQSSYERLGIPASGTVFELDVCSPGDGSCSMLRVPNIS